MAITVPIGGLSFLVMTVAFGELAQLVAFPVVALAWLAGQGMVHFAFGRYCNYEAAIDYSDPSRPFSISAEQVRQPRVAGRVCGR